MIFNSNTPAKLEWAIDALSDEEGEALRVSEAFELIRTIEGALALTQRVMVDPTRAGWPGPVVEELQRLRVREERAFASLRVLCVLRALERDSDSRRNLTNKIRERLLVMRRCARKESFLYLESFWDDISLPDEDEGR